MLKKTFNWKKPVTLLLILPVIALTLFTMTASAASPATTSAKTDEVPYESYTYWEEFGAKEKTAVYCKPMYSVKTVIDASAFGTELFTAVTDICTDADGRAYILDSGATKIYVTDSDYRLINTIDKIVYNGEALSIDGASGILAKDGKIYVADTKNARVLVMNNSGEVEYLLPVPDSKLIPSDFVYRPVKVAVDSKNYTYIASDGSYYGALVYSPEMEFLGFYGANTVQATALDIIDNIIDKLFSNDTKKGATVLALPYQFNDLAAGPKDFIYTATGSTGTNGAQTGQICMMNPGGKDVLGRQAYNFSDIAVGVYKNKTINQSFSGIDVDDDGFFYAVDSGYGRVFWYDKECNLMSVFGGGMGVAKQEGTFLLANAIAVNGTDVLVSDSMKNSVTVFSITDYGMLVRDAQLKTLNDDFEDTVDEWNGVLAQDSNSQLAYRGLAKAYYSLGDNSAAIKYSKLGADRETYSNAFEKNRQAFLEKWFAPLFIGVLLLVATLIVFIVYKRRKKWKFITNEKIKVMLQSVFHPFEAFRLVKEHHSGSFVIAVILLAVYYIVSAVTDTASGFAFNYFDAATYNSFFVLLSTVGLVILWTAANWLVCVLLGGIGRLKEIFIVTCYSLIPVIFSGIVSLIMSHFLVPEEFVFVTLLQTVCLIYTFFMLMVGIMKVHDFEFGRFFGTTLLTIIAMLIIVFLIFLIFLLTQQVYGWFCTLIVEARYR